MSRNPERELWRELEGVAELEATYGGNAGLVVGLRSVRALNRIARAIERLKSGRLHLSVTLTPKEPGPMSLSITLNPASATPNALFATAPQDVNAHPATPTITWTTTDDTVLALEVGPTTLGARGISKAPGTATVTASAPGFDDESCDVTVAALPNGKLNLSVVATS